MSKKNNQAIVQAEALRSAQSAPVDAEIMADPRSLLLEPFMQSKQVQIEITKLMDVVQQKKFRYYFEDWGCLVCGQKDAGHRSVGMCSTCLGRVTNRMAVSLRRAYAERPVFDKPKDLVAMAQEALAPSIKALIPANNAPALKVLPTTTTAQNKEDPEAVISAARSGEKKEKQKK
jgi:hypothetical protein